MRARVYVAGLGGGVLVTSVLYYPLYLYLPGTFVKDWPSAPGGLAIALTGVGVVLMLFTGVVAARISGTRDRAGAAAAGAVAGLIAALIAEMWVGGAAAGAWGARDLLVYGLKPARNNTEFITLLTDAVTGAHWWTYLSAWIAILTGLGLGALGGGLAGPGGAPAKPPSGTWPAELSLIGVLVSALTLVITVVIFALLGPSTQKAADSVTHILRYPSSSLIAWPVGTLFILLLIWEALGWRWLRRARAETAAAHNRLLVITYVNGLLPLFMVAFLFLIARGMFASPLFLAGLAVWLGLGGITLVTGWPLHARPRPTTSAEPRRMRFFISEVMLSSGVLFATAYVGLVAASLNLVLLVIPVISTVSNFDPNAKITVPALAKSIPELVRTNYLVHQGVGVGVGVLLLVVDVLVTGVIAGSTWTGGRGQRPAPVLAAQPSAPIKPAPAPPAARDQPALAAPPPAPPTDKDKPTPDSSS
jgi:hypothetical protein